MKGAESAPTGGSAAADAAATDVILKAAETMFTWRPRTDTSPVDAFKRALPFMAGALKTRAENVAERGTSAWWQEWKAQKAEATAVVRLVPAEHPKDPSGQIERSIVVTQVVKAPDGQVLNESTFNIDRVVAKKGKDGWRVESIDFFPENQWFTPTCPPGQALDAASPTRGGECKPVKPCPGGTRVPQSTQCVTTTATQSPTTTRTTVTTSPTVAATTTPTTTETTTAVTTTTETTTGVTTTEVTTPEVTTTEASTPEVTTTEAPPPPEEPPPPVMCPDGSVAAAGQTCPSTVIEAPPEPEETFKPPA